MIALQVAVLLLVTAACSASVPSPIPPRVEAVRTTVAVPTTEVEMNQEPS
jgi:hypothetical protein